MTSRDLILKRLKENATERAMPGTWHSRRRFADLAAQFETALTAVHGEVIRADGLATAVTALAELMREMGGGNGRCQPRSSPRFSQSAHPIPRY
ncbi:MAG: hypothetical protein M5U34_09350 [Chloroflexi bacterium]|nr:hypothetical protein [Chloroflexota bacterium]